MKENCEFIPLWEFQISERAQICISRMLFMQKEKDFYDSEHYLKNLETGEEYAKENPKRLRIKTDNEKYYINSIITGFDGKPFRTKGASIFRYQLPNLIKALQHICDGGYEQFTNTLLEQVLNPNKNTDDVLENSQSEQTMNSEPIINTSMSDDGKFIEWYISLNSNLKKEIDGLIKSGWTKEEAKIAFDAKNKC